jgi:hypothetical protein
MNCGDTLLIPAPGACEETPHLWIILTEPDPYCVLVSLSTLRYDKDQTVILHRGDHPFLVKDSVAMYAYARLADIGDLATQVATGMAAPREPCTTEMLRLLRDGILASPDTPPKIQNFYRQRR